MLETLSSEDRMYMFLNPYMPCCLSNINVQFIVRNCVPSFTANTESLSLHRQTYYAAICSNYGYTKSRKNGMSTA